MMNSKNRHWTFIVYPDSANPDWINILIETGLPFAISPLHDKDKNPTGEDKKEHYHVVVTYDGPTTYKSVNENICELIGSTIPKRVLSLRGIYRYLAHLDNPDKYQYDPKDIREYNSFHVDMTETELVTKLADITCDIQTFDIRNYWDLVKHYLDIADMDYFRVVQSHAFYFSKIIDSYKRL